MSQKSSIPQATNFVSQALKRDNASSLQAFQTARNSASLSVQSRAAIPSSGLTEPITGLLSTNPACMAQVNNADILARARAAVVRPLPHFGMTSA
jgi:hypothetical protein